MPTTREQKRALNLEYKRLTNRKYTAVKNGDRELQKTHKTNENNASWRSERPEFQKVEIC